MYSPVIKCSSQALRRLWFQQLCVRSYSAKKRHSISVQFEEHGDPVKVLELHDSELPPLEKDEVQVNMMAAPINPADINTVQGVYPVKPPLPAVGGAEGVGKVVEVGSAVTGFSVGDWVIPAVAGTGTWCTSANQKASELMTIPSDLPLASAATFAVNPCTAYRMLLDFVNLEPGDVVIQNGANSGVGQAVIQIAAARGISTVNVVRERKDDTDGVIANLMNFGATHVITDEFVKQPEMKTLMKSLPKPKLALNCVGGRNAADLLKYMAVGGTMVTYGGMSKLPMTVPAGPLIFNNLKLCGYWMTQWNRDHRGKPERTEMIAEITEMIKNGKLQPPPSIMVPIQQYRDAVYRAMQPYVTQKQILIMGNE